MKRIERERERDGNMHKVVVVTGGAVNLAIRSFVLASAATAGC